MRKSRIRIPMYLAEVCHSKLVFPEERQDLYTSFKANKQALSQLQNKKSEFTYDYFPCHLLIEQR